MLKLILGAVFAMVLSMGQAHAWLVQKTPGCGTPPSQAVNAGFTTCAINADFTAATGASWLPKSFAGAVSGNGGSTSNWLDCSGTNTSFLWHFGVFYLQQPFPCSSLVYMTTDGSTQVLSIDNNPTILSPYGKTGYGNSLGIMSAIAGFPNSGYALSIPVPISFYMEVVFRQSEVTGDSILEDNLAYTNSTISAISGCSNPSISYNIELYSYGGGPSDMGSGNGNCNSGNQPNGFLYNSYASSNCLDGSPCYFPGFPSGGWSNTTYHKYGYLITSDGATKVYGCAFVDNNVSASKCDSGITASQNSTVFSQHTGFSLSIEPEATGGNYGSLYHVYYQYIKVWSCANWATSQCNGSILYNSNGLTYFHN